MFWYPTNIYFLHITNLLRVNIIREPRIQLFELKLLSDMHWQLFEIADAGLLKPMTKSGFKKKPPTESNFAKKWSEKMISFEKLAEIFSAEGCEREVELLRRRPAMRKRSHAVDVIAKSSGVEA